MDSWCLDDFLKLECCCFDIGFGFENGSGGDSMQLDSMDGVENESAKHFPPPCSSDIGDSFGDPQVHPRVGEEYQAKIPPLIEEYTHLQLTLKSAETEVKDDVSDSFLLGLPIPVIWPHDEAEKHQTACIGILW
ncbi:hypothetical protein CK203_071389 [Vitis vinifera]|uniref:Uncharacterized protein n=1 Tax=Vitis vinifera TaxID=29760 RepID=A0A438F3L2_VITVI|nr:hypothetical protein CK203_071389 [Vitis vinifera]